MVILIIDFGCKDTKKIDKLVAKSRFFFDKRLFFYAKHVIVNNILPVYLKYFLAKSAGISMGVSKPGL